MPFTLLICILRRKRPRICGLGIAPDQSTSGVPRETSGPRIGRTPSSDRRGGIVGDANRDAVKSLPPVSFSLISPGQCRTGRSSNTNARVEKRVSAVWLQASGKQA